FFRVSHNPSNGAQTSNPYDSSPTTLDKRANANIDDQQNDSGVANWTHMFSPTFFAETLFTVSRDYRGQLPYTGSEEIASTLGLQRRPVQRECGRQLFPRHGNLSGAFQSRRVSAAQQ